MDADNLKGQWAARYDTNGTLQTKAHLIESEVADRAITNCGREMHRHNSTGKLRQADSLAAHCKTCSEGVL
jgi:hypothetical protein